MKILVVGLGSIGYRHIRNIKDMDNNVQIAVWRQYSKDIDLKELAPLVENVFFSKRDALAWKPDITFITNPATMHLEAALLFARSNSHLFIEKPLADNSEGLDELLEECRKRNLILMVGYVLRFSEPVKAMKALLNQGRIGKILSIKASVGQYLLDWRPQKRYQDTVTARKDLGGGVLLELSHELDYMRWLVGEITEIQALTAKVSDLELDVEDVAEIILKFYCGAVGSIHLDMFDRASNRSCRIVGSKGTILCDLGKESSLRVFSLEEKKWSEIFSSDNINGSDSYKLELKHFFECVKNNKEPLISGRESKRVLELILAARISAEKGKVVKV